jgi:hypothetical protein
MHCITEDRTPYDLYRHATLGGEDCSEPFPLRAADHQDPDVLACERGQLVLTVIDHNTVNRPTQAARCLRHAGDRTRYGLWAVTGRDGHGAERHRSPGMRGAATSDERRALEEPTRREFLEPPPEQLTRPGGRAGPAGERLGMRFKRVEAGTALQQHEVGTRDQSLASRVAHQQNLIIARRQGKPVAAAEPLLAEYWIYNAYRSVRQRVYNPWQGVDTGLLWP